MFFKLYIKQVLLSIGLLYYWILVYSQPVSNTPSAIIQHYSTEHGLSHSGVMCILQDKLGFMWFGTWDGLNKFDGYKFTTFKSKPGDGNSLSHNRIDDIKEDTYGFLWVKTYDEKVHRFDKRLETFQSVFSANSKNQFNPNINKIISTHFGNIWLTTYNNGCYRIKSNSTNYTFEYDYLSENAVDSLKILGTRIHFIYEDSNRYTWIGTNDGLNCIPPGNQTKVMHLNKGVSVNCVAEFNHQMWFGTDDGKILNIKLPGDPFSIYYIPGKPAVRCIEPHNNSLLLGTSMQGISEFDLVAHTFKSIPIKVPGFESNLKIQSFYTDKYGLVWIETNRPGILRYHSETRSFRHFIHKTDKVSPFVYYGDYFTIFEDINDYLWINLRGGGFCYYNRDKDQIEYFYNEPGSQDRKFSNLVTFALSDSRGNLWLSTHTRGLEKICFIRDKFKLHQISPGSQILTANEVRALFEDRDKRLWISTKEGKLYCFDQNRVLIKVFSDETNSPGDIGFQGMVYSIIQDKSGNFWFGTKGDGIIKAEPIGPSKNLKFLTTHFRNSSDKWSISNNWIYSIFEDSKGRIWAGTYGGGLNLLSKNSSEYQFYNFKNIWNNYPHPFCDKIRYIYEDNKGQIWVGSTNGLLVFNPNEGMPDKYHFNLYQKESDNKSSLANNDVHFILQSFDGTIWLSTFGGGLGKVIRAPDRNNGPQFKNYTSHDGLPIDIILGIQEDKSGNLWLSTENGLTKFNPQTEECINFSELDGIKNLIFSEAACCKGHDGMLYFGSYDGYYSFNPADVNKENYTPQVMLVNFQLFNRDIAIGQGDSPLKQSINTTQSIALKYNQSVFSIEYAGLDYRNSDKLEYAFKLEGFEKEWNYVRHQRKATYTNLAPGKYKFLVMCSSTGVFNESEYQQLEIIIMPPWWKTIWAYVSYVVLFVVIALISRRIVKEIIRLRNKVIIEQKLTELKLRFFTNISHELRTPLTLIMGPAEDVIKNEKLSESGHYLMRIIDKNARRMLRNINHLLDFRKIQSGNMKLKIARIEMVSFIDDIVSGFRELAVSRSIDFSFESDLNEIYAWIDPEKIDTVIFNLLSNAFKFTPEGKKICIQLKNLEKEKGLQIRVIDQGIGIAKEDLPLLFERFAISHNPEGFSSKGTGIGLSLVKEIIRLHKGKVWVESKQGEGSTFTIELRTDKQQFEKSEIEILADGESSHAYKHEDIEAISETPPDLNSNNKDNAPTILIVEDNPDLRQYIKSRLYNEYNILEAADGISGFKIAVTAIPDLIISDIMMPGIDGIELTNRLRSEFKTSHIPIILLTAKSSIENIIEGFKYGADAYITKPFSMELLVARIASLVEQRKKLIERFNSQVKIVDLSPDEIIVTAKDEQFLKDVIKIIEDNMADPDFHVEKIASNIGLGRTTFFKKLKGLTGLAPVEFMREMKLKRGYQLLESSEYTVSEVAYMLGFSDAGYFTKCFKEKYNITPTEVIKGKK